MKKVCFLWQARMELPKLQPKTKETFQVSIKYYEASLWPAKTKDKTWLSLNTTVLTGPTQSGNLDGNHYF